MRRIFLLLLPLLVSAVSCEDPALTDEILLMDTPALVSRGERILVYDEAGCQLSFNRDRAEFGVFRDNLSDFFIVSFDRLPSEKGEELTANIRWSTADDIEEHKNIAFEVLKLEGDKVWLKSESRRIHLVLQFLI